MANVDRECCEMVENASVDKFGSTAAMHAYLITEAER